MFTVYPHLYILRLMRIRLSAVRKYSLVFVQFCPQTFLYQIQTCLQILPVVVRNNCCGRSVIFAVVDPLISFHKQFANSSDLSAIVAVQMIRNLPLYIVICSHPLGRPSKCITPTITHR